MPIGDPYATVADLKARLSITDTTDDTALAQALLVATETIEGICDRQFNDSGVVSARLYYPEIHNRLVRTDDFSTTTGLVVQVDNDGDGTFETTFTSSQYQVEPLNGVVAGRTGYPYWFVRAVGAAYFPRYSKDSARYYGNLFGPRASVQVTAQWGWAKVPAAVREACLFEAEEIYKLKDIPTIDEGLVGIRPNPNPRPKLILMLERYIRRKALAG